MKLMKRWNQIFTGITRAKAVVHVILRSFVRTVHGLDRRHRGMAALVVVTPFVLSLCVSYTGGRHIVVPRKCPRSQAAIVLGAGVKPNGKLSDMLRDRVMTSVELYKAGKVYKLLMSGDHGKKSYDEVNAMRRFAEKEGVPTEDIFMDHAGFCTYDSMYRAKAIFKVKSAVVVTQRFHLARSVFLAHKSGIKAAGVAADKRRYRGILRCEVREILARCQDFIRGGIVRPKPKYLGPAIPITGDGRETHG